MRKLGLIVLGLVISSVVACDGGAPPVQDPSVEPSPDLPVAPDTSAAATAAAGEAPSAPEPYDRLNMLELGVEQAYFDELIDALSMKRPLELRRPPLPDGFFERMERGLPLRENWMNCTRFLTNNPAAGFCEDEPPASWRPFMFNDQRYFVVPLGPTA